MSAHTRVIPDGRHCNQQLSPDEVVLPPAEFVVMSDDDHRGAVQTLADLLTPIIRRVVEQPPTS